MKAMVLKDFGSMDNLVVEEVAEPQLQAGEVLIRVKSIGIDPVDVKTRRGEAQARSIRDDHPMILGWDVAGVITGIGNGVRTLRVGNEVFGVVNFPGHGRTYAEYVAAPADQLALKPPSVSFEEAAASTLSALTAWQALVKLAKVKSGDKVLIHGASGGVGHFAVQIAKHFGAYVIGTASAVNRQFVMGLGVDRFIDYKTQYFEELVSDLDIIVDPIGGENFARSVSVLKPTGTIINLPSNQADRVRRIAEEKGVEHFYQMLVKSDGEDMKSIAGLLENGRLKAHVFKVFPFERIPEAHAMVETGKGVGKIVVRM